MDSASSTTREEGGAAVRRRNTGTAGLDDLDYEDHPNRPPFILTRPELKLLSIAGVGFFLDAYDLFIINPVTTLLQYRLYGGHSMPTNLSGPLKAATNMGAVVGQIMFGYLGDSLGRKAVYGKELIIIIFATILCISTPTGDLSPKNSIIYLTCFRALLGIGIGGDYPMSASVSSDRTNLRKRGTMLSYVFANQGWGSLVGAIVFIIVLQCYHGVMNNKGEVSKVDGVWRILVGLSLVPAAGTLYQRLTMPESTKYIESQKIWNEESAFLKKNGITVTEKPAQTPTTEGRGPVPLVTRDELQAAATKKEQWRDFVMYFSEWRHFKVLFATCMCWFLLDIAFYGINLNTNQVLTEIGYDGKTGNTAWEKLHRLAIGNLIITALGFVPGYYVTVLTIEYIGRKKLQFFGFLLEALFLGILAGKFYTLSHAAFIVNFSLLQFFFNFGANTTTFLYPAEVFPTRFRAFAHGLSAASGKAGAIISSLLFNSLSNHIGPNHVLWIFFGVSVAGAFVTLLLPEVQGRDPDLVYAQELADARAGRSS
ncbi:hypothetical protein FRB94_008095 [Tulasnella sp. JGI-2019a]|nr:hypothetical protein FRB94_008095 [Tulasnella sp. JGI-2019a]KAG9017353.1 hypothetical protein FRB93_007467 [Tulasnella sp. JGI-2019a]KAG9034087.1 hypothetical protein FRB95_013856 [Tulasnella sp. JGI-2019a]